MKGIEKAYWISPDGKIKGFSKGCHIEKVCNNPTGFGVSEKWLKEVFNKHNERWSTEGRAREEIIIWLVKQRGWMRLRKYNRPDRWALNIGAINQKKLDYIRDFAFQLMKKGASQFEEIRIDSSDDGIITISLENIVSGFLAQRFNLTNTSQKYFLKFVDGFMEEKNE